MSDEKQPAVTPQPGQDQSNPSVGGIALGTIISIVTGLASAALGAGPWGIGALALLGLGSGFGLNALIKAFNRRVDGRDQGNAGADAGNTAVDMANQASGNLADLADLKKQIPKPPAQ